MRPAVMASVSRWGSAQLSQERRQGELAQTENAIMEIAQREAGAFALGGGSARFLDLDHPGHVRERLPRHGDVAVYLDDGVGVYRAPFLQLRDRPVSRPSKGMDTCIGYE